MTDWIKGNDFPHDGYYWIIVKDPFIGHNNCILSLHYYSKGQRPYYNIKQHILAYTPAFPPKDIIYGAKQMIDEPLYYEDENGMKKCVL